MTGLVVARVKTSENTGDSEGRMSVSVPPSVNKSLSHRRLCTQSQAAPYRLCVYSCSQEALHLHGQVRSSASPDSVALLGLRPGGAPSRSPSFSSLLRVLLVIESAASASEC